MNLRGFSFITIFSLFSGSINAQQVAWNLQSEKDGVKLYSATAPCEGKSRLLLKLENTNTTKKHVNYSIVIESPGHNMPLRPQSIELDGSESKTGDCDDAGSLTTDLKEIINFKLVVVMRVN